MREAQANWDKENIPEETKIEYVNRRLRETEWFLTKESQEGYIKRAGELHREYDELYPKQDDILDTIKEVFPDAEIAFDLDFSKEPKNKTIEVNSLPTEDKEEVYRWFLGPPHLDTATNNNKAPEFTFSKGTIDWEKFWKGSDTTPEMKGEKCDCECHNPQYDHIVHMEPCCINGIKIK